MNQPTVHLAIDLGASSGRVIAGVHHGERLDLEELHRFPNGPVDSGDGYRWDADGLFREIRAGLAAAAARFGDRVVSLGVDTWGVDYGLVDGAGRLVEPPFSYRDGRTEGMMEEAFRRMPRREIYERTGIQFMPFNTVFQVLSEVASRRPQLERAERLLFMPDLFNYRLCGRMANEYSIASTSQLLDARTGQWDPAILSALGLPPRLFGEIVRPGTLLGRLQPELAAESGLGPVEVIAVGSHDTASAVAAVPATPGEASAYLSSGTWSLMGVELPGPVINDLSYGVGFTNEGGVCDTIRLLKNIAGLWLVQECQRTWAENGEDIDFGTLAGMAERAEPFLACLDPDHPSFAAPGDMPGRIQAYCRDTGQAVPQTKGQIVRVVLESLAFRYRWVFDNLETLQGAPIGTLRIVGGGTRNRVLTQFAADALNRRVVAGPVEATAIGNILLQIVAGGGLASLAEARALVARSFDTEAFAPGGRDAWEPAYRTFLETIPA